MNPRIFALGLGVAIGYVLGTRAGRERYEQMKSAVTALWEDPRGCGEGCRGQDHRDGQDGCRAHRCRRHGCRGQDLGNREDRGIQGRGHRNGRRRGRIESRGGPA